MKQCISRVIGFFTHLWRTLKAYVCKHRYKSMIKKLHVVCDKINSWIQILDVKDQVIQYKIEEVLSDDIKSDCLLESSRTEENEFSERSNQG